MSLRKILYQFCNQEGLQELSCIIHFAIVNYVSTHKSKNNDIYFSPEILNSFIGIGKENIIKLLSYLSEHSKSISKSYELKCPIYMIENDQDEDNYCDAVYQEDFDDKDFEVSCESCGSLHTIAEILDYHVDYIGNRSDILKDLEIASQDIANEMVILNTNPEHMDKLANIIVSRLNIESSQKEETKQGLVRILNSVKDVSGLIAGISGDVADTSSAVRRIVEDWTLIGTLKDVLSPGKSTEDE